MIKKGILMLLVGLFGNLYANTSITYIKEYVENLGKNYDSSTYKLQNGNLLNDATSLKILYNKKQNKIVVWAVVSPFGHKYFMRKEYLSEIVSFSKNNNLLMGGSLELKKFPEFVYGVSKNKQPWLLLRKEYIVSNISKKNFNNDLDKLSDLVFSKYTEVERTIARSVNKKLGRPKSIEVIRPKNNKNYNYPAEYYDMN
jgi:hypothetical protein